MTIVKFTVDVTGDDIDQLVLVAEQEALKFYKDLPGKFRAKEISVSYDPEYYQSRIQHAIDEAQAKADAYKAAHGDEEDFEDLEVIPGAVPRYSGWIEFEYETNQSPKKKTLEDIQAERNEAAAAVQEQEYKGNAANDPKYQDAF